MRVTPQRIGLLVFALACLTLIAYGQFVFVGLAFVIGAFALVAAREIDFVDRLNEPLGRDNEPRLPFRTDQSVAMSDELLDLFSSVVELADRQLADEGRIAPFVLYDAGGSLRMRRVPDGPPVETLRRAREQARAVHPDISRVILVVQGEADIAGQRQPAVTYEAAERAQGGRGLVFVQPLQRGRLVLKAGLKGRPVYLGESGFLLRLP